MNLSAERDRVEAGCILFLAIACRDVSKTPTIADAAALASGQLAHWGGLHGLTREERQSLAVALRFVHPEITEPWIFLYTAQSLMLQPHCYFLLVDEPDLVSLTFDHRYQLAEVLDASDLIQDYLHIVRRYQPPVRKKIPIDRGFDLRAKFGERYQYYSFDQADLSALPAPDQTLPIPVRPEAHSAYWSYSALKEIAEQLDASPRLHGSHLKSLQNLLRRERSMEAAAGIFYRVNAPTGSGKTVLMVMMAIDAARRGESVVLVVPGLLEVEGLTAELKNSLSAVAPHLTVAPLHGERRLAEIAARQFDTGGQSPPYEHICLLQGYATDSVPIPSSREPCFGLRLVESTGQDKERISKIAHCPFLFKCGKTSMLAGALKADIVVVNHDALLAASTSIPLEDSDRLGTRRSYLELLLRTKSIFLVDEIDGLLSRTIKNCTTSLELGGKRHDTALARLRTEIDSRPGIQGMKQSKFNVLKWALTFTAQTPDEILDLCDEKHFRWPSHGMRWPQSEDKMLQHTLQVDPDMLEALYRLNDRSVPKELHDLHDNLTYWGIKEARAPADVIRQLTNILKRLSDAGHIRKAGTKSGDMNAALILRGALGLVQEQIAILHRHMRDLLWADVPNAREVENALEGTPPITLVRNGPLQHPICGFKYQAGDHGPATLHVETLKGDPHATLQFLPNLTSLAFSNAQRVFIGLSATAHFPGASRYDLPATDLIDVPDAAGQISFCNLPTTAQISGSRPRMRKRKVRDLAEELALCLPPMMQAQMKEDPTRGRFVLITNSDSDAEVLAIALRHAFSKQEPSEDLGRLGEQVLWIRGKSAAARATEMPADCAMFHHELPDLLTGEHKDKRFLVSSLSPIARGHNIVHPNGRSAIGAIIVCVRPLPPSDNSADTLGHVTYDNSKSLGFYRTPGEAMVASRSLAYRNLNAIRFALPNFSSQPENIRHFTIMNILVDLAQLAGRGRRGETPITCYFGDAAFVDGKTSWADLLRASIQHMKKNGEWDDFCQEHAGMAGAMQQYIR
ncbi:UNVERIFIED_ORG: hypothetical protein J2W65_000694 [Pseudomonas parafulva]|nr:hypothetical protein [Pseudomonas parafulva]